ncbi:MAG: hypothetical protein M3400_11050 [Actinomycetota bacterium]|nr:hypothetical protein [Actinomycetota bacterium]
MRRRSGWTIEEAELLLESLVGPVRMISFKYGWIALPTKTEGEGGRHHLGPVSAVDKQIYVIDRDAQVITAHASVAPTIIAKEYTRARRQGMVRGIPVWPTAEEY